MMTPQEVASHSFAKATLGGYNLAQVDEFLDALTEDYTSLYNENAILKNKLKVLSETVEEYRATETTMRKAILAAQQVADDLVDDARRKHDALLGEAEQDAQARIDELDRAVAAEAYRLRQAQESTAAYVRRLAQLHDQEMEFLSHLGELVPPEVAAQSDPSAEIKAALDAQARLEEEAAAARQQQAAPAEEELVLDMDRLPVPDQPPEPPADRAQDDFELDMDATRRYTDLKFGKDYEIQ